MTPKAAPEHVSIWYRLFGLLMTIIGGALVWLGISGLDQGYEAMIVILFGATLALVGLTCLISHKKNVVHDTMDAFFLLMPF